MPPKVMSERDEKSGSLVGEAFASNTQSQQLLAPHLTHMASQHALPNGIHGLEQASVTMTNPLA